MFQTRLMLSIVLIIVVSASRSAIFADPPIYKDHQNLLYYIGDAGAQKPVDSVQDWELRRAHVLANMESVMGPLPKPEHPVSLDSQIHETTELEGKLIRKHITYHTDNVKQRVAAYLFIPPHAEGEKLPAMLCLQQTNSDGKVEAAGLAGEPNLHYGLYLAQRGYVTLVPDYPSFGESAGYDFDADDYVSGTMKAIYDNIRGVDLLQSLPEVDGERIGVIGHSLGGHNAMFTAAFEPRLKVIVSSCGFSRFQNDDMPSWTPPKYLPRIATVYGNDASRLPFDFTEIVGTFAPRPFLACAAIHDYDFDLAGVKEVIRSASFIYRLYKVEDNLQACYPDSPHDFPPEAREVAYRFIDQHLKKPH